MLDEEYIQAMLKNYWTQKHWLSEAPYSVELLNVLFQSLICQSQTLYNFKSGLKGSTLKTLHIIVFPSSGAKSRYVVQVDKLKWV